MKRNFTLIEVLIALSVLCLGILAVTQLLASAQTRVLRAREDWKEQHALSLATDFYLLASPQTPLPEAIFPYRNYTIRAEYLPPGDVLPAGVPDRNNDCRFVVLQVSLYNEQGELLRSITVNQILEERQL